MQKILKFKLLERRLVTTLVILLLLLPSLLTVFVQPRSASAAQLIQRKITIGTSKVSATDVTYSVSFKVNTPGTIKGLVIQFCATTEGPLIGNSCPVGPAGFNDNTGSLVLANQKLNNVALSNPFSINGASDSHTLILTNATGTATVLNDNITLDLGSSGGSDGITNPNGTDTGCSNNNCTFYARVITYASNVTAAAYADTVPGTHIDDGGIAMSTAAQLVTSARIQETLSFCVGSTTVNDATTSIAADCTATFLGGGGGGCGDTVDLGILDSSVVSVSPVPVATTSLPGGGNNCNGAAMVRTNASNGVVITYYAEQESGSGKLKVIGASCSGSSNVDQCFNDSTTQTAFVANTEAFGVTVGGVNKGSTTSYICSYTASPNTCKLEPSSGATGYLGAGGVGTEAYGTTNGWAWQDNGTPTTLASSTGPVDDEALVLRFAAAPTITTPTGTYFVTSTYIATSTF